MPTRTSARFEFRLRAWRRRHLLRERRAEEFFAASRNPERGLPVADRRAVRTFFALAGIRRRRLHRRRCCWCCTRWLPSPVWSCRACSASLVDEATAPGTLAVDPGRHRAGGGRRRGDAGGADLLALRMSVVFGQDLLAEAREYVVRTVLGLPLGRVESASSGDLVTRVTRDVSTMSESVRYGLPEVGDRRDDDGADRGGHAAELARC